MKKLLSFVLLAALMLPWVAKGQNAPCVSPGSYVIGNEASTATTYYYPVNNYYNYTLSETIITAEEIGMPMTITGIKFYYNYSSATTNKTNVDIYLQHTTKSAFSGNTNVEALSATAVKVYHGHLNCSQGWNTFTFDTVFEYNGNDNLMVIVDDNSGAYNSSSYTFRTSATTGNKTLVYYSDSSNPNVTSLSSSYGGTKAVYQARVLLSLMGCDRSTCARPSLAIGAVTSSSIEILIGENEAATGYLMKIGNATEWQSLTGTTVITDLESDSTYTFTVAADCNGDTSNNSTISARTLLVDPVSSLPYTCGFEADQDSNWRFFNGTATNKWYIGSAVNNGGSSALYISDDTTAATNTYNVNATTNVYAYRAITFTEAADYAIDFDWRSYGETDCEDCDYVRAYIAPLETDFTGTSVNTSGWIPATDVLSLSNSWQTAHGWFAAEHPGTYYVVLMWHNDANTGVQPPAAIDNMNVYQLDCPAPRHLALDTADGAVTANTLTLDWTPMGTETSWALRANGGDWEIAQTHPYPFSGLQAASYYTFDIVALCNDSSFSTSFSTRTACGEITLPWMESFEGMPAGTGQRPLCWDTLQTNGNYPYVYASNRHSGTNSLYMYGTSAKPNTVVSPIISGTNPDQLYVTFWANASSSGTLYMGVVENTDLSTFVVIDSVKNGGGAWREYEFYTDGVTLTDSVRIAFQWRSNSTSSYSCYLDDILIRESSDCRRPTAARVDTVTYYTADLSWTDPTENGQYILRYAKTNNLEDSNAVDLPVNDSVYTLTNLRPYTTYYAWVAASCDQENWRPVGGFTTARSCYSVTNLTVVEATAAAALVTWSYDTVHGIAPDGVTIDVIGPHGDTAHYATEGTRLLLSGLQPGTSYTVRVLTLCDPDTSTAATITVSTTACGEVTGTTTTSYAPFYGLYDYGYSQTLYPASILEGIDTITGVAFRTTSTPTNYPTRPIVVYIGYTNETSLSTSNYLPATSLTQVASVDLDVSSIGWKTINFTSPVIVNHGQNIVIAVVNNTGEYSGFSWGAHTQAEQGGIGNSVYWYRDGTPITPDAPAGSNSSITTIPDIRFMGNCDMGCVGPLVMLDSLDENGAHLSWTADGDSWFPQYRIAGTSQWEDGAATTETSATIGGLVPSSCYEFRVAAVCGQEDTGYSSPRTARTSCGDITLPWAEGFEGMPAGSGKRPLCWDTLQVNSTYPYVYASSRHSGVNSLYMYGNNSQPNLVATPKITVNFTDPIHVKFWANAASTGKLYAGILTDSTDATSFIAVDSVTAGGGAWREYEFYTDVVNYANNLRVAFLWRANTTSNASCYIDDISIALADPCRRPIAARVDTVTYYTATISWTDTAGNDNFVVRYSMSNDPTAAGVNVPVSNDTVCTLTGLRPATTYYAWVASSCNGILTDWRNAGSFTTTLSCYPITNLTANSTTATATLLTWRYNTQVGIEPTGVVITVTGANDTTIYHSTGTQLLLSGLQPGTSYTASIRTVCEPDTATAVSTTISTTSCGEVTGTTNTSYSPAYGFYDYSYSQTLYPASMLEGLDTITGVAFRVATANGMVLPLTVYIGYTNETTLTSTSYLPATSLTAVSASTIVNTGTTGWKNINFTSPVVVNHGQNIVIAVVNNNGEYSSDYPYWGAHTQAQQGGIGNTIYWYQDGTPITPSAPAGTPSSTTTAIPDIRFLGHCDMGCIAPLLMVDSTTQTSATLAWTADGDSWVPQYRKATETAWTSDTATTATTATITGLDHSTLYAFRVMALCESGDTSYSAVQTGFTDCGLISLPYRYGFEDAATSTFPHCWNRVKGYTSGSTEYPYVSSTHHGGARSLYIYGGATTAKNLVTTPFIPMSLNNLEINFWAYRTGAYTLEVGVMTDLTDSSVFTVIDTLNATNLASASVWYEFNYTTPDLLGTLADSGYLAFRMNGSGTFYIDDIEIMQYNPCFRPVDFQLDSVSPYTASLSWSNADSASGYRIYWADTNDFASALSMDVTTNNYTITGLLPHTTYYLWARTLCGNSMSELTTVGNVTTQYSCYPIRNVEITSLTPTAASFAWSLDSRGLPADNVLVALIDLSDSTADTLVDFAVGATYHILTGLTANHDYKVIFTTLCDPDTAEALVYTFHSPEPSCLELSGSETVSYAPFYGYYKYGYCQMVYPASEMSSSLHSITSISFRVATVPSSYPTRPVRVFMGNTTIDTVTVGTLVPDSLLTLVADTAVMDVSTTGWTTIELDTAFAYTPGSNLVIAVENHTGQYSSFTFGGHASNGTWVTYYTDANEVTYDNLTGSTQVSSGIMPDIRFHGDCDEVSCVAPLAAISDEDSNSVSLTWFPLGDESAWIVEYRPADTTVWTVAAPNVTTTSYTVTGLQPGTIYQFRVGSLCTDDTVYSTILEDQTECVAVHIPVTYNPGDYVHGNSATYPCWSFSGVSITSNGGAFTLYFSTASSYIILPEVAEPLNTTQVRVNVSTNATAGSSFRVGVLEGTMIHWVDTVRVSYTGGTYVHNTEYVTYLNNYTGNGSRVVLGGITTNTIYFWEFTIEPMETCFPVDAITFTGITDEEATAHISHPTATSFEVQYREANETTWRSLTLTNTDSVLLTGLDQVSTYVVRARAICSAGDTSRFGNVQASFATLLCPDGAMAENFTSDMTATTNSYAPIGYSNYNYSYVQTIIDSAYLATLNGDITALAFHPANTTAGSYYTHMDVYMANISETVFASTSFLQNDASHPFVHVISDATFNYTDTNWQMHAFDTNFTWDGHSNVLVAIHRDHGSYTSGASFRAHSASSTTEYKTLYKYQDSPGPVSMTDASVTGTRLAATGDLRLYSCATPIVRFAVNVVSADNTMGSVLPNGIARVRQGDSLTVTAIPHEGYLFTNWKIGGQVVSTDSIYSFLPTADMTITAYFETAPDPDCLIPTNVTVSNVTFDAATINWTAGEEGQDTWEVRVYNNTFDTLITAHTTSVTLTGLYPATEYSVIVRTLCSATAFSVWTTAQHFETPDCTAPTGVTLDAHGTSVTVNWRGTGADKYRVTYYLADWTTNGTNIEVTGGATTTTVTGLSEGESYDFYVYAYCGTILSTPSEKATVTLGIYEIDGSNVTLYPNPATTTVTLTGIEGPATVTIADLNGRTCGSWTTSDGTLTIDLTGYAQGAYFIRVAGERTAAVRKLIVK